MEVNSGEVFPGQVLSSLSEMGAGEGTYVKKNGQICSSVRGKIHYTKV
jgi:exosome complex RNA-binding protein Rrp4